MTVRMRRHALRPAARWKAGAIEFQLPEGVRKKMPHRRFPADAAQPSRLMRPLLVFAFLLAFASIGVGFGGLDVDPESALAPDTPAPLVIVPASSLAADDEPPAAASAAALASDPEGSAPVLAAATGRDLEVAPSATPIDTTEPTATEEPATSVPEPTAAAVPPTATAAPPPPTPTPDWDYHPVAQLSAAEVTAAAASAGWPAQLIPQVVEVAWCESSYRPNASNGWAYGVMQLVPGWFDFAGVGFAEWTDPVVNLRVAYAVFQYDASEGHAPWHQWVCKPSDAAVSATAAPVPTATVPPPAALGGQ
jgi:hypothetical protein